jgi:hypothetical protein
MNKILMFVCSILMVSSVAGADETTTETCANGAGTIVKGVIRGEYCLSKNFMNWFNAASWCDGMGLKLIEDLNDDCGCDKLKCTANSCPNLAMGHSNWAVMGVWGCTTGSYSVSGSGSLRSCQTSVGSAWEIRALCKIK